MTQVSRARASSVTAKFVNSSPRNAATFTASPGR